MSFREKSAMVHILAFLTLLALVAISAGKAFHLGDSSPLSIQQNWIYIIIFIAIEIIGQSVIAAFNRSEANQSLDERDKNIQYKSSHFAWLFSGAILLSYVCWELLLGVPAVNLYNVWILLIISEILKYSFQYWFYRRGF